MRLRTPASACAAIFAASGVAGAQTATQLVRIEVTPVSRIGVTSASAALVIDNATAGEGLTSVTATGGSWSVTTNESNQKVTASIDRNLPAGVQLEVQLAPPAGAVSPGGIVLGTTAADVVTGIERLSASGLPMAYRLSASASAPVMAETRTVTFTIVSGT